MSSPSHAVFGATAEPTEWSCVCHEGRLLAAVYDHLPSCAPVPAVAEPVTAIPALTVGPASHLGDDLACFVAPKLRHYLR
jgi:hypothetical protein